MQSVENGALLPPNSIVGTCGTRSLFGCLISNCDEACDNMPIRCPGAVVSVADQLHELTLICNELPASIAEYFYLQASRQFATDSKVLLRDVVFNTQPGDQMFCIGQADGEQISGIRAVCINGVCSTMGTATSCAGPWGHFQYRMHKDGITLKMPQDCSGQIRVTYYSMPTMTACDVDQRLADFNDGIVALAAARLLSQPNKAWSGNASVKYYEKLYMESLGRAKLAIEFSGSHPQYMLDHGDSCVQQYIARNPY